MARLTLKSRQQILGDMVRKTLSRTGLNDLNPGSLLLTLLEAASAEDEQAYFAMLQIVRNYNIDTTTGSDLDNRAFEYGLTRLEALAASGRITVLREEGFQKISSSFYSGFRSRVAGDTEIFLNDASLFPSTGTNTLIIGRGTANEEEVTYTAAPQDFTNYWRIALATPLTNDHLLEESVILKQGVDSIIPAGTIVKVPASGRSPEVVFSTVADAILLAGEASLTDVEVRCQEPGTVGNVGVGAITGTDAFAAAPFLGARALNESAFSSGQDLESDAELRARVKSYVQSLSQSTKEGIRRAISNLVDPVTAKRVVSTNIVLPDEVCEPVKVYIDDGTGFEPSFEEQGQETILENAAGGERRLQLELFPLVKAQVETGLSEPFDMNTIGLTLSLVSGPSSETITFNPADFAIPEAATSEEIVRLINDRSTLVEARTSQVGSRVVLQSRADENEEIQVTGGTANARLAFSTALTETFYLYLNDRKLSKDGRTAQIDSGSSAPFNFSGVPLTLTLVVDGKTANPQTVTFQLSDFSSPAEASAATATKIASIINAQVAGAQAIAVGGKVRLSSNTTLSSASRVHVTGGTANAILGFSTVEVVGADRDYTLNPELGVIELVNPLVAGDRVSAATRSTRGFLTASEPEDYTFVGGETLDVRVDGGSVQTITFLAGANQSAQAVADRINETLQGGTAITRTVDLLTFLEVRTNTFDPDVGSIEVTGGTALAVLGLPVALDRSVTSHVAYAVAGSSGPWDFVEGETLAIVLDDDPAGKTFVVPFGYSATVSTGASSTVFTSAALLSAFQRDQELQGFDVSFKSGPNTTTGTIYKVTSPSVGTFRYWYLAAPPNYLDFDPGDVASFSAMNLAQNNGNFLVTALTTVGTMFAAVIDKDLSTPPMSPTLGDRYLVHPDAGLALQAAVLDKDRKNPFDAPSLTPSVGDRYIVAPDASATLLSSVKGRFTDPTNPGVSLTHGFRYIVDGVGVGDWAGHNFEIAQYNGVGSPGWIFFPPTNLDAVYSENDNKIYQFLTSPLGWTENRWGGSAGKVTEWNGSAWVFFTPLDKEVRVVSDESLRYQYAIGSNSWAANAWGSEGNHIAEWNGSAWTFTTGAVNDTVLVTDESKTYQLTVTGWVAFEFWVEVSNAAGSVESGSTGTGLLGQRRAVSSYDELLGQVTLAAPLRATPTAGNSLVVTPSTALNVRDFLSNLKVTSLSTKADVELARVGARVQISSKSDGSDGYVQVTGGKVNQKLLFSTSQVKGLRGYAYYTGLVKLVHRTVYGDERDLSSYPGVGAAGVKFQILAPTVQEVAFSIRVKLRAGVSLSSVEGQVRSVVTSYVNGLGVGDEVILASIVDGLMELPTVVDAYVTSPTVNVVIAEGELARTKSSLVSVTGGA